MLIDTSAPDKPLAAQISVVAASGVAISRLRNGASAPHRQIQHRRKFRSGIAGCRVWHR